MDKNKVGEQGISKQKDDEFETAVVYNLKKILKFNRKSPKIIAQAMPINESKLGKLLFFLKYHFLNPILQF